VSQAPGQEGFRLSLLQRRLWWLGREARRAAYAVEVPEGVTAEALRQALSQIVERHEILRTSFVQSPGIKVPLQVIAEEGEVDWSEEEGDWWTVFERERERVGEGMRALLISSPPVPLSHRPPPDRERGNAGEGILPGPVGSRPGEERQAPEPGPPSPGGREGDGRGGQGVRREGGRAVLVLTLPALQSAPPALRRLLTELAALLSGQPLEEPNQYVDAAEWQRERLEADDEEAELGRAHWRRQGPDVRFPTPPFEAPGSGSSSGPGWLPLDLPMDRLATVAAEHSLQPSDLLRAAWWIALRRLAGETGEARTAVAEPFEDDALEGVLGPLARWIPLQAALDDTLRFHQAAAQLVRLRDEAAGWQRSYEPPGGDEPSPWPVGFEPESAVEGPFRILRQAGGEPVRLLLSGQGIAYDPARFASADVETLAAGFLHLLDTALADPNTTLADLSLAAPGDGAALIAEALEVGPLPVHRRIAEAARRTPDAPAITAEGRAEDSTLSYAELEAGANRLARALRRHGVGPDVPVALYLERSPALILGLVGILQAGGAYVPFDTSQPARRIAVLLEEVRPAVTVTQASLAGNLPAEAPRIVLDQDRETLEAKPADPLDDIGGGALPESLAYVIFTSGSTGRPKGVGVEHRQLQAYLDGVTHCLDLQPGWSWASVSTIAADLGHTAVFPCLTTGGHLHLISQERASDAEALAEYFSRHPVDGLKIVPTHLEALQATAHPERVLPRRRLVLGGEASRRGWADTLRETARAVPDLRLFNHYGPTETTVGVLTFPIDAPLDPRQPTVPIGRPLPNTAVHLLDRSGRPVLPWEPGEVHVGGVTVSRGYLGRPDLTAERFVPDPFSETQGARLYRTGDLARLLPSGAVEFLGRRDHQVKYHGFRVELNEIRAALASHPQVRDGVVQLARDADGRDALIAYYVSRQEIDPAELRALLAETLIEEVVPHLFVHLRKLPLTLNGKVNRAALPGLDAVRAQAARVFVPPATDAEIAVAAVWSEVLGIEKVSAEANFFELGGHSLLATRIISRLRESRGVEVPLRAIFETPTVAGLARRLEEADSSRSAAVPTGPIAAGNASFEDQLAELEGLDE
jgi:amino acid adenylation domain-containing protein